MVYWLFRLAALLARWVPVRISYAIARGSGLLAYAAWHGGRTRAIANMHHIVNGDDRTARRLARRSFANYAVYLVDFLRFTSLDAEQLRSRVIFDGWEALHAQRTGNGIVFITMHFGNWDLGAAGLALNDFPIVVIADTFSDPRLNERVLGARRHLGMEIVPAERMGPAILRGLRRNDVVAVLIDIPMEPGQSAVTVDFFGAPVSIPDGPARIALRTGATVVAATVSRVHPWGEAARPRVTSIPFTPTGDAELDVRALTQATMHALEAMVRDQPEQWYIFRNLWPADRVAANNE